MRVKPSKRNTETLTTERDAFPFKVSAELVGVADVRAKSGTDADMDYWHVTIREELYGGAMQLDYRTGLGLRDGWKYGPLKTLHDVEAAERTTPVEPDARGVLSSVGLDLGILDELPADDGAALDYLMTEYGHAKASDALESLRTMRRMRDDVARMLRGTGLSVEDFAEWCRGLDE